MSKSLVLGNGSMLVGLDVFGQIKDLYYDYVGLENHLTEEAVCKIGVWVEGQFSWLSDPSWEINIDYRNETLASNIHATNNDLSIALDFLDVVYNEKNIFLRFLTVHNKDARERQVKVFLNHQFRMYGVHKKDTVYFDPLDSTIVHYKGRRMALVGGQLDGASFSDYTVGLSFIEGKEGTWMDAEDGLLSKNAIEHGTVDSTVCFEKTVDADKAFSIEYWVCMGKTMEEIKSLHQYVLKRTPEHLAETAQDFWHAWVNKSELGVEALGKDIQELHKKSLLIIRTHVDNNGGIIASGDSTMLQYGRDNYTYIWHRDAAFVAMALDRAGYHEVARKFYEFSNDTITEQGYFFHKYRSDKSLGSSWHGWITPEGEHRLPIQEDETALVVCALWCHYEYTKDLEFIEKIYNSLIKKATEFMLGFRNEHRLPNPTYDLWEQRWGIHAFTVSTVYSALQSASRFAKLLGKEKDSEHYEKAASEVQDAFSKYLFNEKQSYFYKYIDFDEGEILHDETVDISSFYAVVHFGILDIDDKRVARAYETIKNRLVCNTEIGGISRYENDEYYRVGEGYPGNPWIITTLWLAQYYIARAKKKSDLGEAMSLIEWATARASSAGIFPEQVNPYSGKGLSAAPLIWSHAEYVTTVLAYIDKLKELK